VDSDTVMQLLLFYSYATLLCCKKKKTFHDDNMELNRNVTNIK